MLLYTHKEVYFLRGTHPVGTIHFCNECREDFIPGMGYYRCDVQTCEYDLCVRCYRINVCKKAKNMGINCLIGHPAKHFAPTAIKRRMVRSKGIVL